MNSSAVNIVHCIDTEGPLSEPIHATFERLESIFELKLEPTLANLTRLQRKEIDLDGLEKDVAKVLSPELLDYHDNWGNLDLMLNDIMSEEYRNIYPDSFGSGWVYNWHCLDFVGFKTNPRNRDAGYHKIFDHYLDIISKTNSNRDGIHFHHHPVPFSGEGHHSATSYFSPSPVVYETLARRIIDRNWFPCANRPGFHTTRPDSHWLMEQHIPFDIANQSTSEDYSNQKDLSPGRFGDWRRAPKTWTPYHPDHDDHQIEGNCRRWIARCLNIGSRVRLLTENDITLAFQEAAEGKPVVLSFTHHDFRDMRPALEETRKTLKRVADRFPNVPFRYCEARDAMRWALEIEERPPINFSMTFDDNHLRIDADAPTFGPQPFFAIKTTSGEYLHDNLDFQSPNRSWSYVFDENSIKLDAVQSIGIGACDGTGNVTTSVFSPSNGVQKNSHI